MAKPTTKHKTTNDLFNMLSKVAEPVTSERKGKKNQVQVDLNETEQETFDSFCSVDMICKIAELRQKEAKNLIIPLLKKKLLEKWLQEGKRTENPIIQTEKSRANFIVRDVLKIDLPENEDGTSVSVKDRLVEAGFNENEASDISNQEFNEQVEMTFRSLNELRKGTPTEQKIVKKLLTLILENFSTEEQQQLLRKETKVEVKQGFLDRAVKRANGSLEKLEALLSVVTPQWVLSHMTCSENDLQKMITILTDKK